MKFLSGMGLFVAFGVGCFSSLPAAHAAETPERSRTLATALALKKLPAQQTLPRSAKATVDQRNELMELVAAQSAGAPATHEQ